MLGIISVVEQVDGYMIEPVARREGRGGTLGVGAMISVVCGGFSSMDGYRVKTDKHEFFVLIDNGQSCCESWGYLQSEDDLQHYIGAELREVNLTDTALNKVRVEKSDYYDGDEGGIQFVDFVTDRGTFQLAVYNSHNGYYGHGIEVAKDMEIILKDTL